MRKGLVISMLMLLFVTAAGYLSVANATYYTIQQITMSEIDQPWTMLALTDDPNVTQVTFTWYFPYPSGGEVRVFTDTSLPFEDTITAQPGQEGCWWITFEFKDENGETLGYTTHTEFVGEIVDHVVPEFPLLGTIGGLACVALGFSVYYKKRRN